MKYLLLTALFFSGCFWSHAEQKTTTIGTLSGPNFRCRYMAQSQYTYCGVDLFDCVIDGRPVEKIVCANNVTVERF